MDSVKSGPPPMKRCREKLLCTDKYYQQLDNERKHAQVDLTIVFDEEWKQTFEIQEERNQRLAEKHEETKV